MGMELMKDIEAVIAYSRKSPFAMVELAGNSEANMMKYRLDAISNKELNCFDKLRYIFAVSRYNLGLHAKNEREEYTMSRMSFNFTVKLINQIVRFDEIKKSDDRTIYVRNTEDYSATLQVEKYRMNLKVIKDGKLYFHRMAGDGVYVKEKEYPAQKSRIIAESDLGPLKFVAGLPSDFVELSYQFDDKSYKTMKSKFEELLIRKGFICKVRGIKSGMWSIKSEAYRENTVALSTMASMVTLQELQEGLELYKNFLKEEGFIK